MPDKRRFNNILKFNISPEYLNNCLRCAKISLDDFLNSYSLSYSDIDLMVLSQAPPGFAGSFKKLTGIGSINKQSSSENQVRHTSGLLFELESNWEDFISEDNKLTVFLTVSAGIEVSIALYNKEN